MELPIPFQVDARSATPIYDQIVTQVKYAVAAGTLRPGEPLPSVRQLAVALRVNPNTVARAYRDLEADGVVETRAGRGTFVGAAERRLSAAARRKVLSPAVERLAAEGHALGLAADELGDMVRDSARRLAASRTATPDGGRS